MVTTTLPTTTTPDPTENTTAQYYAGQFGALQPLVSDLLTPNKMANRYLKQTYQGDTAKLAERLNQYSKYDTSQLGGLSEYFKSKSPAVAGSNIYMKPAEFEALQSGLSGVKASDIEALTPMLGGLKSVGTTDGVSYYERTPFEEQLGKYTAADLSPYQYLSNVQGVKPVATFGGQTYYEKPALENLATTKNYWDTIDPTVMKILGSSAGQENGRYYTTGTIDPTKFQVGAKGYKTRDIGNGKYEILDAQGNPIGIGYKSVLETINQMAPGKYQAGFGGGIADWEVLGQLLSGKGVSSRQRWGSLPISGASEVLKGEQTLYGSTPILYNGKVIGYTSDLAAAPGWVGSGSGSGGQDQSRWNPFGYQASHSGKSHSWATALGRQIDPAAYTGLVQGLGGSQYYTPLENVSKLPGWTNVESYQHQDKNYGGWGSALVSLGKALGPLDSILGPLSLKSTGESLNDGGLLYTINKHLATIDPLGEKVAGGVADALGIKGGSLGLVRTVGVPVADMIGSMWGVPIGSLVAAADAASQGNEKSMQNYLKNAAISYGTSALGSSLGGGESVAGTGVSAGSAAANQAINQALINSAAQYARTGNLKNALVSGALGGLGGYVGGTYLGGSSPSALQQVGRVGLSSALGGLGSAATGGKFKSGALSGLAGGLSNTIGQNYGKFLGGLSNPVIRQMLTKQVYR